MRPGAVPIQFAAQSYQARSGNLSVQRLVNLYLEPAPQGSKAPSVVYGTPGLKPFVTVGGGAIRGLRAMGDLLWVVSGESLYSVDIHGTSTLIGPIEGTGNVYMTDNGVHLGIATRTKTYAANGSGVLELPESGMCGATYQDGYGIFPQANTETFWITDLDDMTTIGGTSFSTADAFADYLVGAISDHRELLLFGQSTIEVWYNSGATFPFERAQGGFVERGCACGGSIAKADNSVFWLGDDLGVYTMSGYQAQRISTHAIEKLIEDVADPHSAWAFIYRQEGHVFYVLTFSDLTIVYDIATGLWHERVSEGLTRWRVSCHEFIWDTHYVGDYLNGQVYELDLATYSDDGDTITREAVCPAVNNNGERVVCHELFLDMDGGIGLNAGQGSDPIVLLDWSDDGGNTWSSALDGHAGHIGDYGWQVRWSRLGAFRQRAFRVRISDPVKVAILGACARLEAR